MTAEPFRSTRALPLAALGCFLVAAPVLAAPGDPLGGDDTGCAPSTKLGLNCAKKTLAILTKLRKAVISCHLKQADLAFKAGEAQPGFGEAEENCEIGPSATSAKNKFDGYLAKLAASGCDATVLANAAATGDVLLGGDDVPGSLDSLNATFFCDPTSGEEIDPDGDDGGFIPATEENFKCSAAVAKYWAKHNYYVDRCHMKLAAAIFVGKPFDEEACEETDPRTSALARYNAGVGKYIAAGYCPPCLADPPGALGLGTGTIADADASLEDVYICPGP
jgi:hypothetical protein